MTLSDIAGLFGYFALTSSFIICAALIIVSFSLHFFPNPHLERFAVGLTHLQTILLAVSVILLGILLQIGAFEYETVFNAVENAMAPLERIGGLWSSQAASLLFWSFIMSGAVSVSMLIAKHISSRNHIPTVLFILEFTLLFFLVPDVFFSNPFLKTWVLSSGSFSTAVFPPQGASLLVPVDGQGMNPSLRHIAMFFHPPTLYLGLIGFFIPYAFALSSLIHDDREPTWLRLTYPIVISAWMFLTIGMLLGSWWAYTILGWGGYWGWDAVEISGLLPWLLSFGLVHSINMQLRGKNFKSWVYPLAFAIVILTLFGILITRSGILESVHAYTSGAMGPMLTTLVTLHLSTAVFFLIKRQQSLSQVPDERSSSFIDRLTRLFNRSLVGLALIYLIGQTLPLTSQLFLSRTITFTPIDYEWYSSPLVFTVLILTALFPLAAEKESNPKQFNRKLILLVFLSALFPLLIKFRYPISLVIFFGFWAGAFLLSSWIYTAFDTIFFAIRRRKSINPNKMRVSSLFIHLGFAVMAVGILGVENLSTSQDLQPALENSVKFAQGKITYLAADEYTTDSGIGRFESQILLTTTNGSEKLFIPFIEYFPKLGSLHAQPATLVGFFQDIQIVLSKVPDSHASPADLHIKLFPFMSWIWTGGTLMVFGGVLALISRRKKE